MFESKAQADEKAQSRRRRDEALEEVCNTAIGHEVGVFKPLLQYNTEYAPGKTKTPLPAIHLRMDMGPGQ